MKGILQKEQSICINFIYPSHTELHFYFAKALSQHKSIDQVAYATEVSVWSSLLGPQVASLLVPLAFLCAEHL